MDESVCGVIQNVTVIEGREESSRKGGKNRGREKAREERGHDCVIQYTPQCECERNEV